MLARISIVLRAMVFGSNVLEEFVPLVFSNSNRSQELLLTACSFKAEMCLGFKVVVM